MLVPPVTSADLAAQVSDKPKMQPLFSGPNLGPGLGLLPNGCKKKTAFPFFFFYIYFNHHSFGFIS